MLTTADKIELVRRGKASGGRVERDPALLLDLMLTAL
jgi:hypothetical protein